MLLALTACNAPSTDGAATEPAPDAAPPIDVGGPEAPTWTLEEAMAALETGLALGFPDPVDLRSAYEQVVAHSEDGCPRRENAEDISINGVWYDDCVTSDGTHFDGMGIFEETIEEDAWDFGGVANLVVTEPDGRVFEGAGGWSHSITGDGAGGVTWSSLTGGVYGWDDAEGWLGDDGEAGLAVEGAISQATVVTLDGGVGYSSADVAFEVLVSDSATCDGMPQGSVLVRDPTGFWFEITLADCEACAQATWRGEDMGEACPGDAAKAAIDALVAALVWP